MAIIELKNIVKTFPSEKVGEGVHAVKDVSLSIEEGDIFGIIGYSGAGKSTLVRCINLLESPTSGEVLVEGKNITAYSEAQLRSVRRRMGMIFQHFNLLNSANVFENVAAPLKNQRRFTKDEIEEKRAELRKDSSLSEKEIKEKEKALLKSNKKLSGKEFKERVEEMLRLTGLEDKARAYPSQLSGGQKQRVAIARALVGKPKILLCDEATSALDPNTTTQIIELLRSLQEKLKLTVVMITHQMEVVKSICNKVAVMEDGKVIEEGSLVEVFSEPKSSITKEFREKTLYRKEALALTEKNRRNLYELTFIGEKANDPAIMDLVRNYPVEVSILFGNIEILSGVPFGTLTIDMKGEGKDILDAVAYLKSRDIKVEELGVHRIERSSGKENDSCRGQNPEYYKNTERSEEVKIDDELREEDKIWNG